MCVAFPFSVAAIPRLVNTADRRSGVNCIFVFILRCYVVLARRNFSRCLLSDDTWWFGAAPIQVLINMPTDTSLAYHVVDVVYRNSTVSASVVSAGAASTESALDGSDFVVPVSDFGTHDTGISAACARWLRWLDLRGLDHCRTALPSREKSGTPCIKPSLHAVYDLQFQRQQATFRQDGRSSESML